MHTRNVPAAGPSYWAALCVASIFGANMGDFVSHDLHLGHQQGLAPVLSIFLLLLLIERWSRWRSEAYYWLAIVALRTAATNLGDLLTHDFAIPYPIAMAGLAAAMAGLLWLEWMTIGLRAGAIPATNAFYWTIMLIAGTLGTAAGDYTAVVLGLGVGPASILLSAVLGLMLAARRHWRITSVVFYWASIVVIRSAGTTVGDFLVGRHGLSLGLAISVTCTGALLAATLGLAGLGKPKPAEA